MRRTRVELPSARHAQGINGRARSRVSAASQLPDHVDSAGRCPRRRSRILDEGCRAASVNRRAPSASVLCANVCQNASGPSDGLQFARERARRRPAGGAAGCSQMELALFRSLWRRAQVSSSCAAGTAVCAATAVRVESGEREKREVTFFLYIGPAVRTASPFRSVGELGRSTRRDAGPRSATPRQPSRREPAWHGDRRLHHRHVPARAHPFDVSSGVRQSRWDTASRRRNARPAHGQDEAELSNCGSGRNLVCRAIARRRPRRYASAVASN